MRALLAKWIIDCLKGDKYFLPLEQHKELHATWEVPKKAENGNTYDIKIDYIPDGVWCSSIFATTISMEHAVDFDKENDQVKFDHEKLGHLVTSIESALASGGNYELASTGSHGLTIVRIE